jgi:hypothetical protein
MAETEGEVVNRKTQGRGGLRGPLERIVTIVSSPRRDIFARLAPAALLALLAALALAGPAVAANPEAHLELHTYSNPTSMTAANNATCAASLGSIIYVNKCNGYQVTVTNTGALPTSGAAVLLDDTLPAGFEPLALQAEQKLLSVEPTVLAATGNPGLPKQECSEIVGQKIECSFHRTLKPDQSFALLIVGNLRPGAQPGEPNVVTTSGGGANSTEETTPLSIETALPFGLTNFLPRLNAADGSAETLAGGHPYEFRTTLELNNAVKETPASTFQPTSIEDLRDAVVDLPPGVIGSATAAPYCKLIELASEVSCPSASRVGQILTDPLSNASVNSGLYNITPEVGVPAEFGFKDLLDNVHVIYASVAPTPAGYVVRATTPEAPQIPLNDVVASFFGNPAAKNAPTKAAEEEALVSGTPMFTDAANCSGQPLITHAYLDSWQAPAGRNADGSPNLADPHWVQSASAAEPVSGCDQLIFEPTIAATPETNRADTPSGLEVDLKVPQTTGPETLATPPLRKAVVTLPAGFAVNPSSANGLDACSLAQIGMSPSGQPDAAKPTCPEASKIGTVELETPALPGVLQGQIFVARQGENPFGSLLAIYIVVNDPKTGVVVKLAGEVNPDPVTGQLQTVVDQSPQFPFSELRTHFFGGNRAPLRTPSTCGAYEVTSQLTPWSAPESGPPATPGSSFQISQAAGAGACPTTPAQEPNHPGFTAGTVNPQAGAYSAFVVRGTRADGDQPITAVNLTLPKGLTGKLKGIPYCPEAGIALAHSREKLGGGAEEIANPSCPAVSQVGTVRVGAGAGPEPYYVTGHAYLTGPYKGAPLSVSIISPAVAGPYDLGDVVVRTALQVDPLTAQISAVSDPIPTILHGIPLDIRSINLEMSRSEFTLNPTSCEKTAVSGEALGQFGTDAALSAPFQVTGCNNLKFKPKLKISLKGSTKRAGHPALKAVLTYPQNYNSYANIGFAQVGLPHSEFIDQGNLNKTCTRPVLLAGACPASTIYGKAKAWTPLLEAPLEGPVYLVGGFGYKLPALVGELNGQIRVLLVGKVDTDKQKGIRNTFEVVPDAPVEKFILEMKGGKKYSLLENSENICGKAQKAEVKFKAQNGLQQTYKQTITNSCKKKGGKGKKGKGAHHKKKGRGHKKSAGQHKGSKRVASDLRLADLPGGW